MSNLNVALTLRLVNQLSGPAQQAAGDLRHLAGAAKRLDGPHGERLARDLAQVNTVGIKVDTTLRMLGSDATRSLSTAGSATATFGNDLRAVDAAATKLDATLRHLGTTGTSIRALDGNVKALTADLDHAAVAGARMARDTARPIRVRDVSGPAPARRVTKRSLRPADRSENDDERDGGSKDHGRGVEHRMKEALAAAGVGYGIVHLGKEAIQTSARFTHEKVRMDAAGMTPQEMEEAEKLSRQLSEKHRAMSQTDILHLLRNTRAVVGSFHEASEVIDPLLSLRTVAMGAHPNANMEEEFDKLIKGMELKGVTQNIPEFTRYMQGLAKALNVFGDTLKPIDYYEMFKMGHQATAGLSEQFMLKTAPTIAQRLGGSSAGQGFSSLYTDIIGGHMSMHAARVMDELGLISPDGAERSAKTGEIKRVKPGGVVGSDLFRSDPYEWTWKHFMPALQAHGFTSEQDVATKIAGAFTNTVAAGLITIFATQRSAIEKDAALAHGAKGLEAEKDFQTRDPYIAWKSVKAQGEDLVNSIGTIGAAAKVLDTIALGASRISTDIGRIRRGERPIAADVLFGPVPKVTPEQRKAAIDDEIASTRARTLPENLMLLPERRRTGFVADAEKHIADLTRQRGEIDNAVGARDATRAELLGTFSMIERASQVRFGPGGAPEVPGAELGFARRGVSSFPMAADLKNGFPAAAATAGDVGSMIRGAFNVDLSGSATAMMAGYQGAILASKPGIATAVAEIRQLLSSELNITVSPTIAPRIAPRTGAVAPIAAPSQGGSGGGNVTVHEAHFHGVRDPAGMHRQLTRMADRAVRDTRSDALHDLGTAYV